MKSEIMPTGKISVDQVFELYETYFFELEMIGRLVTASVEIQRFDDGIKILATNGEKLSGFVAEYTEAVFNDFEIVASTVPNTPRLQIRSSTDPLLLHIQCYSYAKE